MIFSSKTKLLTKNVIWSIAGVLGLWLLTIGFPNESTALLVVMATSALALFVFRHYTEEKEFITTLFLAALIVRLAFGIFVHIMELRTFFGGDALTYDLYGRTIVDYWFGLIQIKDTNFYSATGNRPGWGMNYLVAAIYVVAGKNILAAQSFCAVVGAATAPMIYFCSLKLFSNRNLARTAAFAVAFFPSCIIWSGQLLKDGLIIFLLVLSVTMVLRLQERIDYVAIAVLVFSLFGIITLRFYIFYMVAIAITGSFMIGLSSKSSSIFRGTAILLIIGFGLTYLGGIQNASVDIEKYADLERIQVSRLDLARSAESGFAEDTDVSTTAGAISAIPLGFVVLMLAPFPWDAANIRQAITIPEVLLWWAMIPLMIYGIAYAVRYRLKTAFPILFFSISLALAYSIFQGNVGTAYRQRTQIQVFLFIFVAVGWELWKERRQDKRNERLRQQRRFDDRLRAGAQS